MKTSREAACGLDGIFPRSSELEAAGWKIKPKRNARVLWERRRRLRAPDGAGFFQLTFSTCSERVWQDSCHPLPCVLQRPACSLPRRPRRHGGDVWQELSLFLVTGGRGAVHVLCFLQKAGVSKPQYLGFFILVPKNSILQHHTTTETRPVARVLLLVCTRAGLCESIGKSFFYL